MIKRKNAFKVLIPFLLMAELFSKPVNDDGSNHLCKILRMDSCVTPSGIRESAKFKKLSYAKPIPGSIAVWENYIAIIDPFQGIYSCSMGSIPIGKLDSLFGRPDFYLPVKDSSERKSQTKSVKKE